MLFSETYEPEYESLKELLIEMAQERSVEVLLDLIVRRMTARPHVAIVRIWLIKPGDGCDRCELASRCEDRTHCLHLVAGGGKSTAQVPRDWTVLTGRHQRIPIGCTGIGRVAALGRALRPAEIEKDGEWINREVWAPGENLLGFGAQPLLFKDAVLGVIAIYSRIASERIKEGRFWLRMISNHTASAIAAARAFSEIDRLKSQLELENAYLREEINAVQAFGDIIGQSPQLTTIINQIDLVAPTDANVFIFGESGTGKELVAREIHKRSRRRNRPMIRVNCAAIPGELYESEFFGHVRGAFTGAVKDRAGRFQAADGGTLFLDEVGEIPFFLQGKLLRVLQEGTYERIGEEHTRLVDVRIIAATNKDMKKAMKQGAFRQDLFYRLNVFPIHIPPLRERKEDIELLAQHFLKNIGDEMKRTLPELTPGGMRHLTGYSWPGNVRELRNVIERSVITSQGSRLGFDLKEEDLNPEQRPETIANPVPRRVLPESEIQQFMRDNILAALSLCKGKIYGENGAAAFLQIAPTTLASRMKKFGIKNR